jgi:misacylated tRNA(Ala) deacylase
MHLYCHDHPDTLVLETAVLDATPGKVRLAQLPFYPGGGGQLADRGLIRSAIGEHKIAGFELIDGALWAVLADPVELSGTVQAEVDAGFRRMMRQMHTATHVLNAMVFQQFDGALVTGVQMADDGTARMDFDVPGADNDRLRALAGPVNDAIRQNLAVVCTYEDFEAARAVPGLLRSRSVTPPPTEDGKVRIVDIVGLDRQACGGTHLDATSDCPEVQILKIDNKGRHNRRIRIGLIGM